MTKLLEEAINKIQQLSPEQQDAITKWRYAIASRFLEEWEDEQKWKYLFKNTTDEQWGKMAEKVKQDILNGEVTSLDDFLEEQNEI